MVKMLTSSASNASLIQAYTFSVYDSLSYKTTIKTSYVDLIFFPIWTEQNQAILQNSVISINLKLQLTSLDTC